MTVIQAPVPETQAIIYPEREFRDKLPISTQTAIPEIYMVSDTLKDSRNNFLMIDYISVLAELEVFDIVHIKYDINIDSLKYIEYQMAII